MQENVQTPRLTCKTGIQAYKKTDTQKKQVHEHATKKLQLQ